MIVLSCSQGDAVEYMLGKGDWYNPYTLQCVLQAHNFFSVFFYLGIYEVHWPSDLELSGSPYTHLSQCELLQYFIHTLQQFQFTQQFSWNSVLDSCPTPCRCLNTACTSWMLNIKHKGSNHVAWKGIKADYVSTEGLYPQDLDASAAQACLYTNPVECINPRRGSVSGGRLSHRTHKGPQAQCDSLRPIYTALLRLARFLSLWCLTLEEQEICSLAHHNNSFYCLHNIQFTGIKYL